MISLILTVGTGTAGNKSDLAQGLVNTLELRKPDQYWLVPSSSPASKAIADHVRTHHPQGFVPWYAGSPYPCLEKPDDLHECRRQLREVIRRVRDTLPPGGRLIVNPTSGTKQMSTAATLAALDEEIGEIVFTVGERSQGVVMTGREELAAFSTRQFFLERDMHKAETLYQSGAFFAAAKLLDPWQDEPVAQRAANVALCAHEWQRLNYAGAAVYAERMDSALHAHLQLLAGAVAQNHYALPVLADLLRGAEAFSTWGDMEESASRSYKAFEYAVTLKLVEVTQLGPKFMDKDFPEVFGDQGENRPLGLAQMVKVLKHRNDEFAGVYDKAMKSSLSKRNENIHMVKPVRSEDAKQLFEMTTRILRERFPGLKAQVQVPLFPVSLQEG
jgi:hypothetical protein